jgi:Fis family transcriptional regulator
MNHSETLTTISDSSSPTVPMLLSNHVKQALELYFSQLKGHDAADLYNLVIREVEKPLLESALTYYDHNQSKTAKALGLSRSTLRKKLDQYGLS